MITKVPLSPEELLSFGREQSYWEGFAAGVKAASDHAQQIAVQKILNSRKPEPPKEESPPKQE